MHNALHTILYQPYVFELLFCIALHCVRLWEPSICIWVLPVFGELGGDLCNEVTTTLPRAQTMVMMGMRSMLLSVASMMESSSLLMPMMLLLSSISSYRHNECSVSGDPAGVDQLLEYYCQILYRTSHGTLLFLMSFPKSRSCLVAFYSISHTLILGPPGTRPG